MGKNHRHQKNLKSERAKVKLKAKKLKTLPKGQNVTDTSFKVKKIIIKEQLKSHELDEIVSRRKLNVKEILTRLQHHNSTVRQDATRELRDVLQNYPPSLLSPHLSALLQGASALALDRERDIRRDTLRVLSLLLSPLSPAQLSPFSAILISHLCCAMTHINPAIKADSLSLLDTLTNSAPSLIPQHAQKLLPLFLDMISTSSAHSATPTNSAPTTRHLTTPLSTKNTALKWRIKVLQRLSAIFSSITLNLKTKKNLKKNFDTKKIVVDNETNFLNLFWGNNLDVCELSEREGEGAGFGWAEFKNQVEVLVPLMMEGWSEVKPREVEGEGGSLLTGEGAEMLKVMVEILVGFLEMGVALGSGAGNEGWGRFLMGGFPYAEVKVTDRGRKRQGDFGGGESSNLVGENIGVGVVVVGGVNGKLGAEQRENVNSVLDFVCDRLRSWSSNDTPALPILGKFLRLLFLKSSKNLYKNEINLGNILRAAIAAASRQPKRELQNQLFIILGEIVLDHRLNELQSESAFKNFVKTLPELLLQETIHENTIQMLNRAVLQHGGCIRLELAKKQEEIIENAKKIQIIGTSDEQQSRLMICNLLHFLDGQIYF